MWFQLACILLLAVVFPAEGQRRIVPISYDATEVPTTGGGNCPTQAASQTATNSIVQGIQGIIRDSVVPALQCGLGECEANPGTDCNQIYMANPASPSGNYWLQGCDGGSAVQVYCAMGNVCGCSSGPGGWMRIAYLNATDPDVVCPHEWSFYENTGIRTCQRGLNRGGCGSSFYDSFNLPYSRVCGRMIGYQYASPDAFRPYFDNQDLTIDDLYVDGVSITHGFAPRTHIWTFANGVDRVDDSSNPYQCPCDGTTYAGVVPPFIGNDWFCETGSPNAGWQGGRFYNENPLWDGEGCNSASTCCSLNSPPWFCKELPQATSNNLELRLCADQHFGDETTTLNFFEIYVQ